MRQAAGTASPLGTWLFAVALSWGTVAAYEANLRGNDAAGFGAILLGLMAVRMWWAGLVAHDERQVMKVAYRASTKRSTKHGGARWATRKDTQPAGMENPSGIFLGRFKGRDLFYPGEGSMLALAPPAGGKTTALAMQHLLRSDKSTIIIDPKLENYAVTAEFRRKKLGHQILLICPWWEGLEKEFGGRVKLRDEGFDPCSFIDPNRSTVIDDCALLASLLLPEPAKGASDSEDFWRDFSASILVAFMLLELSRTGKITLPRLRQMIMAPEEQIDAAIAEMMTSDGFSGVLAEYGARLYSPKCNSEREWSGGISGAMRALRLYDAHGPLGKSCEKAGVDFSTFKDQPTTVYVGIPSDKVSTHKGYAGMVVTLAMEMIARDRRKQPCVLYLDEFQNLGRSVVEPILKGIALYRGVGLQFVLLVQFLPALRRLAGDSWREFFSVDLVTAFGAPSDPETLEMLSKLTGSTTLHDVSYSSNSAGLAGGGMDAGMSSREVARPLLRPEEIRMLPKNAQLIFTSNLPPIMAEKQSYLDRENPKVRRRASKNPYYA